MDERTSGLILRTRPLTDTSLIVHWLTRDFGRLATVAKGAHRKNSPFRGKLDLFFLADLSFRRARRSDLHLLREVSLQATHPALRRDLGRLQQTAYCARLIEQSTETDTPIQSLYELLLSFIEWLPSQPPAALAVLIFELKLLRELGLEPSWSQVNLSPKTVKHAREWLNTESWPASESLSVDETEARELSRFLHGFLIYHLGKIPSGRFRLDRAATLS
jgi:DNA repair protein RecO (recombination protein O)